jgi:hypothetical protein
VGKELRTYESGDVTLPDGDLGHVATEFLTTKHSTKRKPVRHAVGRDYIHMERGVLVTDLLQLQNLTGCLARTHTTTGAIPKTIPEHMQRCP